MGIKDLFWFEKEKYEERIKDRSRYSDERIHRERSHKARQQFSGCWSIGNGLLCCFATGGLTTGIVLYDYRNRSVSKRKLELLEKEAERRGMKTYDQGKRDFWISCISNSVHCFTGCKVDSCLAGMLAEAPVPSYIKDVVQATDNRSEAVAQEKELNSTQTTDNPSKEEVQVNKQVQGQARVTQGLESHVSEPHALEKEVPIVRDASVLSLQDAAGVQVKQPNAPVQGQDRITNVSESHVSGPHSELEAGRRGMKKQKRKGDFWISRLSTCVGFCIGSDSCLIDMLPEALVPNIQDMVQMTDVKPTGAGAQAEKPNAALEGQDEITLREENQVSGPHALEKEAGRRGMKKHGTRKRDFWISCISNSGGFCIGSGADSCLADMLPAASLPSVEDVDQITDVKPSEAGAEERKPITAQMSDNRSEARAQAEKLNARVERQDIITVLEENQVSESHALEGAGRRGMKKREKSKGGFWISRISNSVGLCIGAGGDSCLADMLPRARAEKLNTRVEGQDRIDLSEENQVSETRALQKEATRALEEAGRRGMKKREKRNRDLWISCILSNSVGLCVDSGGDSYLADMLPRAPARSVEDVVQKTDINPSEAGEQAKKPTTVQMTDNPLEAEAQLDVPNTRVQGQDRITQGLEDHVSESYAAVCPTSEVQGASPVPGSVLSCEGVEAVDYHVAVASVLEAKTNGAKFESNQTASSALEKVEKSLSSALPDSVLDKLP